MSPERWYTRYAWVWFALVSGLVLPLTVLMLIDPSSGAATWARFGYEMPASVANSAPAIEYVEFIAHWAASTTTGFDLFGLAIAVTAFRRGERWAWLVFWYWPVMFSFHFFSYQSTFRYSQLVWLVVSVGALVASYRKAWERSPVTADTVAT